MKEEDIRPADLMKEAARLMSGDSQEMLKFKAEFIEVPCPACEANEFCFEFEKGGYDFVRCKKCETLFVNPRPTAQLLNEYYKNSKGMKFWNEKIFPTSEDYRRKSIFIPRAEKVAELCRKYNVKTKILMDVGAGFGTFCEEIKRKGIFERVIAVEPSASLAETCRSKGLEVIESPIEEVTVGGIDVITNFELMEHLFSPKDFLIACRNVLPIGGMLMLTTPNIKGFDLLVGGRGANNINGPNHINYFNIDSIRLLLDSAGFETIEVLTPGKLDAELVRNQIVNGRMDVSNNPFLKQILVDKWDEVGDAFQKFLADNKLSSHMWVVARKL